MRVATLLGLGPALLIAASIGAPAADDAPPPSQPPVRPELTETVEVRLAHVNFIALDRRGRPVSDLTPEEVVVITEGTRRPIVALEPYDRPAASIRAPDTGTTPEPETEPETEAPAPVEQPDRFLVLFFDHFASRLPARVAAIQAALELVNEQLGPRDLVAVVAFDGELDVLQTFTNDLEKTRGALLRAYGHAEHVETGRHDQLTELMRDFETCQNLGQPWVCARQLSGAYENERRREADAVLTALTQTVRAIASIDAPKTLVMFSNGFSRSSGSDPVDAARMVLGEAVADRMLFGRDERIEAQYDALVAAASRAKVSVFTVNSGSSVGNSRISAEYGTSSAALGNTFQIDAFRRSDQNAQAGLAEIARRTGGTANEGNEPLAALHKIFEQTRGLYTVAYDPGAVSGASQVKIKIRRPGVKAVWPRELPRLEPLPVLEGRLTVEAEACSEARRLLHVNVQVDLRSLTFERIEKKLTNNFSVYVTLLDEKGTRTLYRDYRLFHVAHDDEGFKTAPDPAIERTLTAPCRPLLVRAVVVDANSSASGRFEELVSR